MTDLFGQGWTDPFAGAVISSTQTSVWIFLTGIGREQNLAGPINVSSMNIGFRVLPGGSVEVRKNQIISVALNRICLLVFGSLSS